MIPPLDLPKEDIDFMPTRGFQRVNATRLIWGNMLWLEKDDMLFKLSGAYRWLHPLKGAGSIYGASKSSQESPPS